jgi:methionyl-tRNA synthetase
MTKKYFGGIVPTPAEETELDADLKKTVADAIKASRELAGSFHIADAVDEIFSMLRRANKYIDETMPWALAKDESKKARLNDVLYNLVQAIEIGASLLDSFMPETSAKILAAFNASSRTIEECKTFNKASEITANAISPLFARMDFKALEPQIEEIRQSQLAALNATLPPVNSENKEEKKVEEVKEETEKTPEITFDDFVKVEMKVGEIIACEKVEKSNKLLKETVKFGNETRTIVSGIAKHYTPEEMVGKKVIFVTNLAPRKVCGILSEGMILAAEDENGNLALCVPEKDVASGTRVG